MATIILNEAATSLASPNWGKAGIADGDDLIINKPIGVVTAGLNQTALTEGVASLKILHTATAGKIGGNGAGPLRLDADVTAGSVVSNRGAVELHIRAEGDNNLINNLDNGGLGQTFVEGGTVVNATITSGRFEANESTILTNFYADGGSGLIRFNATPITLAEITGGVWTLERVPTTLRVGGNAVVILDVPVGTSFSGTTFEIYGAMGGGPTVVFKFSPFATLKARGGTIDFTQARAAMTPGGTAWTTLGTRYLPSNLVATTYRVLVGGSQESPDAPMPL